MPVKRLCCCPGCPAERLPNSNYCERHQSYEEERREKIKKHQQEWFSKFGKSKYSELYNTLEWRQLRQRVLNECPYCEKCGTTENLQVHHDYDKNVDYSSPEMFFDRSHLKVLCRSCHARETDRRSVEPQSLNCFCTQGHYSEGWMNG